MSDSSKQPTPNNLNNLNDAELLALAESLKVLDERRKYNQQEFTYLAYTNNKEGYKKHLEFFKAGAIHKERCLIAGNRTGKTHTASTEVSFHANGKYPEGWEGRKFRQPIIVWVIGKTHETTRDILQKYLLGNRYDIGTGFLPKSDIIRVTAKSGIPDAIQDVYVKHYTDGVEDGVSEIHFKSYVQGLEAFMGTQVHVIHMDEEPDTRSIYSECLTRTMTTEGIILCTFTPLLGLSDVVMSFLPNGQFPPGGMGVIQDVNKK